MSLERSLKTATSSRTSLTAKQPRSLYHNGDACHGEGYHDHDFLILRATRRDWLTTSWTRRSQVFLVRARVEGWGRDLVSKTCIWCPPSSMQPCSNSTRNLVSVSWARSHIHLYIILSFSIPEINETWSISASLIFVTLGHNTRLWCFGGLLSATQQGTRRRSEISQRKLCLLQSSNRWDNFNYDDAEDNVEAEVK